MKFLKKFLLNREIKKANIHRVFVGQVANNVLTPSIQLQDDYSYMFEGFQNKHERSNTMPEYDNVNSPSHYQHGCIETIDVIQTMLTPEEFIGYCKGNILKYRERAPYKGKEDEDYAKAKWYFDRLNRLDTTTKEE